MVRRFQYLDEATIDDFLGSLELGVPEDEVRRQGKTKGGRAGAKAGPLVLEGERGSTTGVERNYRQNAASKFEALYRLLRQQEPKELWELDDLDDETWKCLSKDALIDLEVDVRIPTISRALGAAPDLGPLVDALQAMEASVDTKTAAQMKALAQFASAGGTRSISLPAVAGANNHYSIVCKMRQSGLLAPFDSLEGPRRLFGQIEYFIDSGERELAVDMAGLNLMNREQRRTLAKGDRDSVEEAFVTGPGAVIYVVALYK